MQNVNLEWSEFHGSVTEGCWVILGSPEGQPGVLLGAGGPPQVGAHHGVRVELVHWPPVVRLVASEGVKLPRLAAATQLLL